MLYNKTKYLFSRKRQYIIDFSPPKYPEINSDLPMEEAIVYKVCCIFIRTSEVNQDEIKKI